MSNLQAARTDLLLEQLLNQVGWDGLMRAVFDFYRAKTLEIVPQLDPLGPERPLLEEFIERQRHEVDGFLKLLEACKIDLLPRELSLGRWQIRIIKSSSEDGPIRYLGLLQSPDPAFDTVPVGSRQYPELREATVNDIVAKAWELIREQERKWQELPFKPKDLVLIEKFWGHTKGAKEQRKDLGDLVYDVRLWSGANDFPPADRNRCNNLTRMGLLQKRTRRNFVEWLFEPEFAQAYTRPDLYQVVAEKLKLN